VTPQVEISSLLPNIEGPKPSGRVDFLVYHPSMENPIIVEIQGEQHKYKQASDQARFNLLKLNGYVIKEFVAEDVELDQDRIVEELNENILGIHAVDAEVNCYKLIQAIKKVHQIQVTIVQAIKYGFLTVDDNCSWGIRIQHEPTGSFNLNEIEVICKLAVEDFMYFLNQMCKLYSLSLNLNMFELSVNSNSSVSGSEIIFISFDGEAPNELNTFLIQDICLPFHIANDTTSINSAILDPPEEGNLLYFLKYLFRKDAFWEGQLDAILRAFGCKDAIVLLPTGGGKSIAFQLASLLIPGRTLVIEPIISLIEDQLDNLCSYGIDKCISITSLINDPIERAAVLNMFSQGEYLLLYIAPERMQMVGFREALRSLTMHSPINIVVVDEAHCVSEWGHDFRTAYLNIGRISRDYCTSQDIVPPLIALTGTASRAVLRDVQRELQIEDFDAIITPKSFDRKELKFNIIPCKSSEKFPRLKGYLGRSLPDKFNITRGTLTQVNGMNTFSGLVFCPWVNGEYGVVQVSKKIQDELSIPNDFYSGKAPKYQGNRFGWNTRKQFVTKTFKKNDMPLLTCTKAFGMGIDKPNIRYTVHYGLPSSIESFYQEAGRAGRDRRVAHCSILASLDDPQRAKDLLNPNTSVEKIAEVIESIPFPDNDDITRALYFHAQAFRGVEAELEQITNMLENNFNNYLAKGTETIKYDRDNRSVEEKCLHRLLLLGIINDYTVDYSGNTFTVNKTGASKEDIINNYEKYISGYLGSRSNKEVEKAYTFISLEHYEFVLKMIKLLLKFVYSVIEKGRRRALWEMFLTASEQADDSSIRERIIRYLEATEHSILIEELLEDPDAGIEKVLMILDELWSQNEAAEIRGQASRYLESYPDYPSLLMLRALTEIYTKDKDNEVVAQNFFASISSALTNYDIEEIKLYDFIAKSIVKVNKQNDTLALEITEKATRDFNSLAFSKTMIKQLPDHLIAAPALHIMADLNEKCLQLLTT
jgi:ATP-dependent DNA helicase RecQ